MELRARGRSAGNKYELLHKDGANWLLLKRAGCNHWIVWRLPRLRATDLEQQVIALLRAVSKRRIRCWKCNEDEWRRNHELPLKFEGETRDKAMLEVQ